MADTFSSDPSAKADVSLELLMRYLKNFQEVLQEPWDSPLPAGKRDPRTDLRATTVLVCGDAHKIINCPPDSRSPALYGPLLEIMHVLIERVSKANNPRFGLFKDILGDWVKQLEKDFSISAATPDNDPVDAIAQEIRRFRDAVMQQGEKEEFKNYRGLLEIFRIRLNRTCSLIITEADKIETIPLGERSKEDYAPLCGHMRALIGDMQSSKYNDFNPLIWSLTAKVTLIEKKVGLEPPERKRG